jgi:2'-5' RNA ligase
MARLFVAVWPSQGAVEALAELRRKDQRGVRFVTPENWHVTLRFLGEADTDDVIDALDGAEFPVAVARLGPAVDVLSDRALVVPVAGLDDLAAVVRDRTARLGQTSRRRFAGHLTIARVTPKVPMPATLGALVHAEFEVREVALVRSRLDPDGARYATVQTWPVGSL